MEVPLSQLRSELRIMLNDAEEPPTASDTVLNEFINAAIDLATTEVPFDTHEEYDLAGNEYALPDRCVRVHRLYAPFGGQDTFVVPGGQQELSGAWTTGAEPMTILVNFPSHGSFYLPYIPEGAFTLYYAERRPTPLVDDPDDDEVGSLDVGQYNWMKWAVLAMAAYYALGPRSVFRSDLEQWAMKMDLNVGNPLAREADRWLKEYDRIIQRYAQASTWDV